MLFAIYFLMSLSTITAPVNSSNYTENGWKGIIPLRSTKLDVEKLLGKSEAPGCYDCTYKTSDKEVIVYYSKAPCQGNLKGWNVPSDTVLEIVLYPSKDSPVAIPEKKDEEPLQSGKETFVLQGKGIVYTVEQTTGVVKQIRYLPKESDNNLRCQGFPKFNTMGAIYTPQFSLVNKAEAPEFIDSFIIDTMAASDTVIYAIAYAGKDMSEKDYDIFFTNIETHAYKKRKASADLFRLVKGGRRDSFSIEVIRLKKDAPPPVPSPDYADQTGSCVVR